MKTHSRLLIIASAALGVVPVGTAVAGIGVTAGDWNLDFSGNVNGFYVGSNCDSTTANTVVVHGLACTGDNSSSVRNGLLPAALVFSAKTRQEDLDIDVTIGFYPGINSTAEGAAGANSGGNPVALGTPGIDARQAFFTFGDASWGSVKIGRDIGLFGKDAILNDMTLLGVGTSAGNAAPGNTSLGRIGLGYIYTDWEPQITYTTPTSNGFSASLGVFQPLDSGNYTKHTSPQFQAGGGYVWGDPKSDSVTGKVWIDVITQQYQQPSCAGAACPPGSSSVNGTGFDGGIKFDYAGFEGVLYGYYGSGVGTTGLYLFATSAAGNKRDSDGGFVQATYKINKLKIGVSYGISELKLASDEVSTNNQLVKRNASVVGGLYYALTKNVNLVGEFINTKATAHGGGSATENDVALGGIIFF